MTARRFPCLAARYMPRGARTWRRRTGTLKKPAWLNDPLNYHDRGNIDFGSCSAQCFEQGDFFGLDDLFTEKPNVMNGPRPDLRVVDRALPRRRVPGRHRQARERGLLQALGAEDPGGGARAGCRRLPDLRRGDAERRDRPLRLRREPGPAAGARLSVSAGRVGLRGRRLRREGDRPAARRRRLLPPAGRRRPCVRDLPRQPRHGPRRAADPAAGAGALAGRAAPARRCSATTCSTCCAARRWSCTATRSG